MSGRFEFDGDLDEAVEVLGNALIDQYGAAGMQATIDRHGVQFFREASGRTFARVGGATFWLSSAGELRGRFQAGATAMRFQCGEDGHVVTDVGPAGDPSLN